MWNLSHKCLKCGTILVHCEMKTLHAGGFEQSSFLHNERNGKHLHLPPWVFMTAWWAQAIFACYILHVVGVI